MTTPTPSPAEVARETCYNAIFKRSSNGDVVPTYFPLGEVSDDAIAGLTPLGARDSSVAAVAAAWSGYREASSKVDSSEWTSNETVRRAFLKLIARCEELPDFPQSKPYTG